MSKRLVASRIILTITLSFLVILVFILGSGHALGSEGSEFSIEPAQEQQPQASDNGETPWLYMPIFNNIPPEFWYFDDFSNPNSGWPVVDNTDDSNDCYAWYYSDSETYRADICDDRTDIKASPGVVLPTVDYIIEVDARFRSSKGWWDSYGILFDAKDDPNPNKPDLGDYYAIWVLWEGKGSHRWALIEDVPGDQKNVTGWQDLKSSDYNYGSDGEAWNTWRIERTATDISVYVNDNYLKTINEKRPTTNYQILFGLFAATYETSPKNFAFDNYLVDFLNSTSAPEGMQPALRDGAAGPIYTSSESTFDLIAPTDSIQPGNE